MRLFPSVERKDAATRRATSMGWYGRGQPYRATWNADRAIREAYERVIWVFRSVDAIASNAARLPILMRKGAEDGPEVAGDPLLWAVNRRANGWETAAQFRYRLVSQLLLSKKGVFVEVTYDNLGRVRNLYLLPCGYTSPVPDPDNFVTTFEVLIDGVPQPVPAFYPDGRPQVLWFRKPHPTNPYLGVTPLEAGGVAIDMDWMARLYNRAFLQNDGRPGGIVAVKGPVDPQDKQTLQQRWSGGPATAGRVSVIGAEDLTWLDTSITPRDAQFAQILALTKSDILDDFGVPESILGNSSDRTFNNARQEKLNFWEETMPPWLDLVAGSLDAVTAGGLDDDVFVVHDLDTVPVIQQAKRDRETHLQQLWDSGLITQDEFREETGRIPFGVPASRSLYVSTLKAPVTFLPGDEPLEPVPPTPAVGPEAEPAEPTEPAGEAEPEAVAASLARLLSRQEKVVLERLRGPKARRGTVLWSPPGEGQIDAAKLLDVARWNDEMASDVPGELNGHADLNRRVFDRVADAVLAVPGEGLDDVEARVLAVYESERARLG